MSPLLAGLERAFVLGLTALCVALPAQWLLDGRVPASWRVWLWRAALVHTALALVPLRPLRLAVLAPSSESISPARVAAPSSEMKPPPAPVAGPSRSEPPSPAAPVSPSVRFSPLAPSGSARRPAFAPVLASPSPVVAPVAPHPSISWPTVLLLVYVLGLFFGFVALGRCAWRLRQALRACETVEEEEVLSRLAQSARQIGVPFLPRVLSRASGPPFLCGVLAPCIVLPRASLGSDALDAILAHELAHLRRRDLGWNALLWLIQTVLWFHPLVWVARRFVSLETESACDELVLSSTPVSPRSYGALLVNTMHTQPNPLTAGVADGFNALRTRLLRLNQSPRQPHRLVRFAFAGGLVCALGGVLPLRLVARAQTRTQPSLSSTLGPVAGTVVDERGQPVAGATVYAAQSDGQVLATTVADERGAFAFAGPMSALFNIEVFADAGRAGLAHHETFLRSRGRSSLRLVVAPGVRTRLRVLDPSGRPARGVALRLWRVAPTQSFAIALPRPLLKAQRAVTNADGEAFFGPLPVGMTAQFVLEDERLVPSPFGDGDRRGGRFAPLSTEDLVELRAPETTRTIRLLAPVSVEGQVRLPDGRGAEGVLVLARRINAVEATSQSQYGVPGRDFIIAHTRSDARGHYRLQGLRPGRYYLWTYPEEHLTRDFAAETFIKALVAPVSRVNFALSRGALIQGIVQEQNTGKPIRGQTMWLFDSQENNQYVQTDARGFFQFRALAGKQRLIVHANGTNSPPPGYALPAKTRFDFVIRNGQKRQFKIELPRVPVTKPVTGQVVGPDGQPVANALISVEGLGGPRDFGVRGAARGDERGRFVVPERLLRRPARLFASSGALNSVRGVVVRSGDDVTLRVQPNVLATLQGQIVDKKTKQPLPGVVVTLLCFAPNGPVIERRTRTDAQGRYRFSGLRPLLSYHFGASRAGYEGEDALPWLQPGETVQMTHFMHPLSTSLGGHVWKADGTPASGYRVRVSGSRAGALTRRDGSFFIAQVLDEKVQLDVTSPDGRFFWGPVWTHGGRQNVRVRLLAAMRSDTRASDARYLAFKEKQRQARVRLIGQIAPELRVSGWAATPQTLAACRGRVVLLNLAWPLPSSLDEFARSFASRGVTVIGLIGVGPTGPLPSPETARQTATRFGWSSPVAVDARLVPPDFSTFSFGQTAALFCGASFVVIRRDGRIAYAGDDISDALAQATALAK